MQQRFRIFFAVFVFVRLFPLLQDDEEEKMLVIFVFIGRLHESELMKLNYFAR